MASQKRRMILRRSSAFGVYTCTSESVAGVIYDVDVRHASRPTCICPAGKDNFRYCTRNPWCKHVRLAYRMHAFRCKIKRAAYAPTASAPAPISRPSGMAALQEVFS